jgi:hypothetical protein
MIKSNFTNSNEWVIPEVPVDCKKLVPIYIYCILLFLTAIIANPLLIWALLKYKDLMNPTNLLILTLAVLNTAGTILELPLVTLSAIFCK